MSGAAVDGLGSRRDHGRRDDEEVDRMSVALGITCPRCQHR